MKSWTVVILTVLASKHHYPPSPAVVEECRQKLLRNGFVELKEKETWSVKPLGKVGYETPRMYAWCVCVYRCSTQVGL